MPAENVDFEVYFRPWNGLMTSLLSGPALASMRQNRAEMLRQRQACAMPQG